MSTKRVTGVTSRTLLPDFRLWTLDFLRPLCSLLESGKSEWGLTPARKPDVCYLKGLNLLLETLARAEAFEVPDFVPTADVFMNALQDSPLPRNTQARLMQHYERLGDFGKAEDALFAMLEAESDEPRLLEFGVTLYQRLGGQSDASLSAGNVSRAELNAGLAELERRGAEPSHG
jgi:hypothetical protein